MNYPQFVVAGENAWLVYFAAEANPQVLAQVQWFSNVLRQQYQQLIFEIVPSYASVLCVYDFHQITAQDMAELLRQVLTLQPKIQDIETNHGNVVHLPCYYSAESGADLVRLAKQCQISTTELIKRHSEQNYLVYTIGFAPGFAYLGWLDQSIASPRLKTPRHLVPAGSVAIADRQTAVYPASSPGGWNLIGNCPLPLFDLHKKPIMPFAVADTIQFYPIDRAEFLRLGGIL